MYLRESDLLTYSFVDSLSTLVFHGSHNAKYRAFVSSYMHIDSEPNDPGKKLIYFFFFFALKHWFFGIYDEKSLISIIEVYVLSVLNPQ